MWSGLASDSARHQRGEQRHQRQQVQFNHDEPPHTLCIGLRHDEPIIFASLLYPRDERPRRRDGDEADDRERRHLAQKNGCAP